LKLVVACRTRYICVAPRAGAWIETIDQDFVVVADCRAPHGRVDLNNN